MHRVCMHMPSAGGGHPLYVQELMAAMVRHLREQRGQRGGECLELVTSEDLEARFNTDLYPIHRILPRLRHRQELGGTLRWMVNRTLHYPRREVAFLRWLRGRGDLGIVHFQEFSAWLPWLCRQIRKLGRRTCYTVHNIQPHEYPPAIPRRLWDHFHRQSFRASDLLFVHTPRLRDQLARFVGRGCPPIHVTPHGTWSVPATDARARPTVVQRLERRRLLFFGTIRRNKGLDLVLAAMPRLLDFHLTIAGYPREADYFRQEVLPEVRRLQRLGIPITLVDRYVEEEEAARLFAEHSLLLLPYTEQFTAQSGVAFMALAHEIPVVGSAVGGLRDLLEQYRIGVMFQDATPQALVAAVRQLYAPTNHAPLADGIREARRHFSWETAAGATLAGYAALEAEWPAATAPLHLAAATQEA